MKIVMVQNAMSLGFRQRVWGAANEQCEFIVNKGLCSAALYNWRVRWLANAIIRYRENHIGLGTKRFVDSLGGC